MHLMQLSHMADVARPAAVMRRMLLLGVAVAMVIVAAGPGIALGEESEDPGPDTMTPIEVPTVTIVTVDADADGTGDATTIVPAAPRSVQVTEVVATVELGGLPLAEVRLCLSLAEDPLDESWDPLDGCAMVEPDPRTHLVMTWRPDDVAAPEGDGAGDAGFRIIGANDHRDADSSSDYLTVSDTEGPDTYTVELTFRFLASVALRAAEQGWTVRVVAVDEADPANEHADARGDLTVEPFFAVTTGRVPMAFGALISGRSRVVEGLRSGEFVSNAPAKLSIRATGFTAPGSTLTLREEGGAAEAGEIALECSDGATLDQPLRVMSTAQDFVTALYPTGTGESADERSYSCAMTYGGGATGVGLQHAGTIAIDIAADPQAPAE